MIQNFEFAGFWDRFVARIIDSIVMFVLSIVIGIIVWTFGLLIVILIIPSPENTLFAVGCGFLAFLFSLIIGPSIYTIVLHKKYGQTIGKRALEIKVIKTNGKPLNWKTAIIRELADVINAIIVLTYLIIVFDSKKQGLHDKIADTVVVRVKK